MAAKASILVVEDEGIVALDLKQKLEQAGYGVASCETSGEKAVITAVKRRPDLVLMDINLRGKLDGIDAAKIIKRQVDVPIIYLTAFTDTATLQRARLTEPYSYLVKPFQLAELLASVEMALYKHGLDQRLKESARWLDTTLKSIGDAVIATDQGHNIRFMNAMAESLTGWQQIEALGNPIGKVFQIANGRGQILQDEEWITLAADEKNGGSDKLLAAQDGRSLPIEYSLAPIQDEQGELQGLVLVFRDITERKRSEKMLARANDQLSVALNQMEATVQERTANLQQANQSLERLLQVIVHDLKEPLRSIEYFSNAVHTRYDEQIDEKGQDFLHRVVRAASHQRRLLNDIGLLAQVLQEQDLRPQRLPARLLVDGALRQLQPLIEEKRATVTVDPDLPQLFVNRTWATLAVYHLLDNALKFVESDTRPEISVEGYAGAEGIGLAVSDRGPGVPAAYADRIFDLFQRVVGRDVKGTGAGLTLVRQIARRHGGDAWLQPRQGSGSRFIVTFGKIEEIQ